MSEPQDIEIAELDFGSAKAVENLKKINLQLDDITNKVANLGKQNVFNFNITGNPFDNMEKSAESSMRKISGYTDMAGKKIKMTLSSVNFDKMIDAKKFEDQISGVTELTKNQLNKLVGIKLQGDVKYFNQKRANLEKERSLENESNIKSLASEQVTADKRALIEAKRIATKQHDEAKLLQTEKEFQARKLLQAQKHEEKMEELNWKYEHSSVSSFSKIANYLQTYLIYQGFNKIKQAASEAINEMVDVESQMVAIQRVMADGEIEISNYRTELISIAQEYGNSFKDVADVTLRLAQAGFDANEALQLTEKTMLALNTADLDATQATEDLIAVMSQWGLVTGDAEQEARDYGDIVDKINKVADNFPTTSEDILSALQKTSSAFKLAGADINETIALIVTAEKTAQQGGKTIGAALNSIIAQLKTDKRIDTAEALGISFFKDANKTEFKDVIEIFESMAQKMQELKEAGKENSIEMQDLISLFTVFRRNIGSALLGEMGSATTYQEVYNTALNATGYSLNENSKYMQTAAAKQQQLNASLLSLKSQVWDNGLEDVYKSMLEIGADVANGLQNLTKRFGTIPVAIGLVIAAWSTLRTLLKGNEINLAIKQTESLADGFKAAGIQADTAAIKTGLMTAAVIAAKAAISFGLSAVITLLIVKIDDWIHAEQKAIEKNKELRESAEEAASKLTDELKAIEDLKKEYEEFSKKIGDKDKDLINIDNLYDAQVLQNKINDTIKNSGQQVELVNKITDEQGKEVEKINNKYKEQLDILKGVYNQKKKEQVEDLKTAAEAAVGANKGIILDYGIKDNNMKEITEAFNLSGITDVSQYENLAGQFVSIAKNFNKLDFSGKIAQLKEWREQISKASDGSEDYTKAIKQIDEWLKEMKAQQEDTNDAINKYREALGELYNASGTIADYNNFLTSISDTYNIEGPKKLIEDIKTINNNFADGKITATDYFNKIEEKISSIDFSKYYKQQDYEKSIKEVNDELDELQGNYTLADIQAKKSLESVKDYIEETKSLTQEESLELEAYEAIFAATTQSLAEGLESIASGFESGISNFVDYSQSIKEAADNTLELYTIEQNLHRDEGGNWVNQANEVNEYANSLQSAKDELEDFGEILKSIGDNYDYISEHATEAGEAMFNQTQITEANYKSLAESQTQALNQLAEDNRAVFETITQDISNATGLAMDQIVDSSGKMTNILYQDAQAMNAALSSEAKQVSGTVQSVTSAMGKMLTALGNAISNFKYNITGKLADVTYKEVDIFGATVKIPNGLKFELEGSAGSGSVADLGKAISDFGNEISAYSANDFNYKKLNLPSSTGGSTGNKSGGSTGGGSKGSSGSGGSGGKSGSGSSYDREAEQAKKEAEEAYKKRLKAFEDMIDDMEDKETRWVKKQKELGQLTTQDMMYITKQRIDRYNKYLDELKKATWMNAEDRLKLEKKYTEKIEDLQLDYMGYIKDQLDEQIKELEDANDKKIKMIKDEADARIKALKKVEDSTSRKRSQEDYDKKRQEILEKISYWEQRTGSEAAKSLKEEKEKLAELDEEWKQQLEDWKLDDQIEQIEKERDAQIEAIEKTQQAEIEAMKAMYDEKVKLFSETNQIIYDESEIASKNLADAYKKNFIDPVSEELKKLEVPSTPAQAQSNSSESNKQYETYTIKKGDTLSKIAKNFGTTVDKIMAANPYIKNKNKIYTGKTLQIPKFHEGGEFGGVPEGLALLKKGEVVLRPEWTADMKAFAKYVKNTVNPQGQPVAAGNNISITGDLIKIQANVRNQTDIDNIGKKVEQILKDKFNIKK